MKTLKKLLISWLLISVLPLMGIPELINYQGVVRKSDSTILEDGSYQIEFRIWDTPIAGDIGETLIWGHTYDVSVFNGKFNVILGSDNGLPSNGSATVNISEAFAGSERYIGITVKSVDGQNIENPLEIIPRQKLMSVPYAYQSQDSNLLNSRNGAWYSPPGFIGSFAGSAIPDGWLLCNGENVSREEYSDLFEAIGVTYGEGDGEHTFALPDLRGEFIRGLDHGRGVDLGRELGSTQSDEIVAHNHQQGFGSIDVDTEGHPHVVAVYSDNDVNSPPFSDSTGGNETRPRNVAFHYIIKY